MSRESARPDIDLQGFKLDYREFSGGWRGLGMYSKGCGTIFWGGAETDELVVSSWAEYFGG